MPDFGVFGEDFQPGGGGGFAVAAPTSGKTGMVNDSGMRPNPEDTSFAVNPAVPAGLRYIEPTLQSAQPGKYATPYYAAKTNSGDMAAATWAADGQAVRLVDPKTGTVLYQGTGPEGAKYATGIANALSEDKGRKAAWAIQIDNGDNGWTTTGSDRKDPKHSLLGTIADVGLPILGSFLLPGVGGILAGALGAGLGAAGGSAISSIAQGRSLENTLLRAGISGLSAGVVGPAAGRVAGSLAPGAVGGGVNYGAGAITSTLLPDITPGLIGDLAVRGASSAIPSAVGAGAGALIGGAGSNLIHGGNGSDTLGDPPTDPTSQATTLSDFVVTATRGGMSTAQIAALTGLSAATIGSILALGGSTPTPVSPIDPGTVVGGTPSADGAVLTNPTPAGSVAGPSLVDNASAWIAAHPLEAAALGLTAAGAVLGGPPKGGGFSGAIDPNIGKRESLGGVFSAKLPPSPFAVRQPRDMTGTDWTHYGEGPEQSFFTSVPQHLARGGSFAVKGPGTGRSDHVNANLSDGEYVVDAETVALLGDGSSKAGADALDRFRVNVRKHKGAQLARGRFSAKAREPDAYMGVR